MKSIPIIIVVILISAGGVWFFVNRAETHVVPDSDTVLNASLLSDKQGFAVLERDMNFVDGRKEFYVEPLTDGTYPGVVMIHEWWGLNDTMKRMARDLAGQGYKVLVVDLYNGHVATTTDDAMKYRSLATDEETVRILREAVQFLREQKATKVASLGFGFGGAKSLDLAVSGEPLDATVIYYAELNIEFEKMSLLKWPILGFFGGDDSSIPVSTVEEFKETLSTAGVLNEIYIYPGVGYAFTNPSSPEFAPNETKEAWLTMLSFLEKILKE